jgi:hypothetical protein
VSEATEFISSCCFNIKMFVPRFIPGSVERFVAINGLGYSIEIASFFPLSVVVIWRACEKRQTRTAFWWETPKRKKRLEDPV